MRLVHDDCLSYMKKIEPGSIDCVITSPPYNIGKEYEATRDLNEYLSWHKEVIKAAVNCLKEGGSLCWQVGNYIENRSVYPLDCLLFSAFVEAGLTPRNRIMWHFGHGLHCKKRFSGRHETVLWFTKGQKYYFDLDAVRVPQKHPSKKHYKGPNKGELSGNPLGKNPSDVWEISNIKANHPEKTEHPCQFPEELATRLIISLTKPGDIVLDPFFGSGTVGVCSKRHGREFIGIEKNEKYLEIAKNRIKMEQSQ